MNRFSIIAGVAAAFAFLAMGSVGVANAAPTGVGNAQDTVNALQADGYAVQLNGSLAGPLSACSVTGVHGLPNDPPMGSVPTRLTTVYVDLDCMSNN